MEKQWAYDLLLTFKKKRLIKIDDLMENNAYIAETFWALHLLVNEKLLSESPRGRLELAVTDEEVDKWLLDNGCRYVDFSEEKLLELGKGYNNKQLACINAIRSAISIDYTTFMQNLRQSCREYVDGLVEDGTLGRNGEEMYSTLSAASYARLYDIVEKKLYEVPTDEGFAEDEEYDEEGEEEEDTIDNYMCSEEEAEELLNQMFEDDDDESYPDCYVTDVTYAADAAEFEIDEDIAYNTVQQEMHELGRVPGLECRHNTYGAMVLTPVRWKEVSVAEQDMHEAMSNDESVCLLGFFAEDEKGRSFPVCVRDYESDFKEFTQLLNDNLSKKTHYHEGIDTNAQGVDSLVVYNQMRKIGEHKALVVITKNHHGGGKWSYSLQVYMDANYDCIGVSTAFADLDLSKLTPKSVGGRMVQDVAEDVAHGDVYTEDILQYAAACNQHVGEVLNIVARSFDYYVGLY